jgi:hypothetical protein
MPVDKNGYIPENLPTSERYRVVYDSFNGKRPYRVVDTETWTTTNGFGEYAQARDAVLHLNRRG